MITDHRFESVYGTETCTHRTSSDRPVCGAKWTAHAMGGSPGSSSLGDGPVRSTVERQQERIKELEAENAQLTFNLWMAKLDLGRAKIQQAIADVADTDREDELERVKAERDMAWDRLALLDELAREVARRLRALDNR